MKSDKEINKLSFRSGRWQLYLNISTSSIMKDCYANTTLRIHELNKIICRSDCNFIESTLSIIKSYANTINLKIKKKCFSPSLK